ncbi:MAG: hypothetical protein M1813_002162 [Trichoglossum hirsutum]|nr:MAG: hypothetical protein M1813_002162 [Trichoglossum hirsutum]
MNSARSLLRIIFGLRTSRWRIPTRWTVSMAAVEIVLERLEGTFSDEGEEKKTCDMDVDVVVYGCTRPRLPRHTGICITWIEARGINHRGALANESISKLVQTQPKQRPSGCLSTMREAVIVESLVKLVTEETE